MTDRESMTAAEMGRRRWRGISAEERSRQAGLIAGLGGRAAWAGMTAEERSAEMRRRAKRRKPRKPRTDQP